MVVGYPSVSIIVLNYNGKQHLKELFNSLKKIDYPKNKYEVIMVDNNSSDGSVEYVKKNFPWVKIIKLDKNYGFAEGNNIGFRKSRGEYVVFLNNDTKVDKNWLKELVKVAMSDEKIAVCGSKVMFYDKPDRIQFAGGFLDIFGAPWHRGECEKDIGKYNKIDDIFYAFGASMLVKRNIVEKHLKYVFDPKYFIYFEETDFAWRIKLLGYRVVYVPTSIVYHKGGATTKEKPYFVYLLYRNKIWSFKKNFTKPLEYIFLFLVVIRMIPLYIWRKITGKWGFYPNPLIHIFDKIDNDIDMKKIPLKRQLSLLKIFNFKKYIGRIRCRYLFQ